MTPLRHALANYLAMRRALGYRLVRAEKLLGQFVTYVEGRGDTHLRTETAVAWATEPTGDHPSGWASQRLSLVRGFATHLHTLDPATEIPSTDLLAGRARRATPYLYTDEDVAALIAAAPATLRTAHRVATYQTLIGLLAITGLRVGEAIAIDRDDFQMGDGLLIVRHGKFGKSRELPLHPTAVAALTQYLHRPNRPRSAAPTPALFVSAVGTRLLLCNVQHTFRTLVRRVGLQPRSATCRPRLHDLRHRFAVCTLLDAYRQGHDPQTRLARLATYLGHVDPKQTYWYLSAAPELLQLAGDRLERALGGV
jgi:integrase